MCTLLTCKLGLLCKKDVKHFSPTLHFGGTNNWANVHIECPIYTINNTDSITENDGKCIVR
jgi:hypothetical protein